MHRRRTFLLLAFGLLVAVLVLIPRLLTQKDGLPLSGNDERQLAHDRGSVEPSDPSEAPNRPPTNPQQQFAQAVENGNVRIRFWGKVVDSSGRPLEGVKVTATIRHWKALGDGSFGEFPKRTALTRADGRFSIEGSGDLLTITSLEKPDYEPERMALRSYGYNISTNIVAREETPVVFRMWKTAERQELVSAEKVLGIVPDGRIYTIDLLAGTKIESATGKGDLRIRIARPTDVKFGDRYDWMFEIEAIDGGLVEEPDRYSEMLLAPIDGYSNSCQITQLRTDARWSYMVPKNFFTRTRHGMYARVKLEIYALYGIPEGNGAISIKYAANPSGSAILR